MCRAHHISHATTPAPSIFGIAARPKTGSSDPWGWAIAPEVRAFLALNPPLTYYCVLVDCLLGTVLPVPFCGAMKAPGDASQTKPIDPVAPLAINDGETFDEARPGNKELCVRFRVVVAIVSAGVDAFSLSLASFAQVIVELSVDPYPGSALVFFFTSSKRYLQLFHGVLEVGTWSSASYSPQALSANDVHTSDVLLWPAGDDRSPAQDHGPFAVSLPQYRSGVTRRY